MSFRRRLFSLLFKPVLKDIEGLSENVRDNNEKFDELKQMAERHAALEKAVAELTENHNPRLDELERVTGSLVSEHNKRLDELERVAGSLAGEHNKRLDELERVSGELVSTHNKRLDELERIACDLNGRMIESDLVNYDKTIRYLTDTLDALKLSVNKMKKEQRAERPVNAPLPSESSAAQSAVSENVYTDIDYFDFENHFRGSRESIKAVQLRNVKYFEGCKNVIDIGCGRGEFLELLKENGIGAAGVDIYEAFVDYCVDKGLKAEVGDGVEYLSRCEKADGIYAGQVVEHISVGQIIKLAELAYEKLPQGKCLILETPNPRSLATFCNGFYIDPSHQRPVHPYTLEYLLRNAGFTDIETVYTENSRLDIHIPPLENADEFNAAMKTVEEMLFSSQDYAIIARK